MKTRNKAFTSLPRIILLTSLLLSLPLFTACNDQPDSSEASSHVNRAETYAEQGQFRSALLEIKNALQKEPDNVRHVVRLGELYLEVGANQEASELLAPWLERYPDEVGLTLARAYVEQGKHLSAKETLAFQTPDSPEEQLEASLIRAKALRTSGEAAEALALYRNLAQSNPSNIDAIAGLLETQVALQQTSQAVNTADEWLARNEPAPEVLLWKGIAQYQLSQLEPASATLTDAVGILPTSDVFLPIRRNVLTTLSRVLTEQGKITEAQLYNRILADNLNTDAREQAEAAISAIRQGNFEEAKSILRDLLKLNPNNERAALMLGMLAAGSGDIDEGAQLLSANLDPETTPTQFIRAATMARIDVGEREEALRTLERAIKARPNDNDILAMHGIVALGMQGQQDAGVASLSKALANEPDRIRLRLALAHHYLRKNQPEQALGQLRRAFASQPSDWTATSTYLNLLIEQGQTGEAEEIRDSLLNGYSDQPTAILLASMADARLGNTSKATKRLEGLADQNPELQAPRLALGSLYAQSGKNQQAVKMLISAARLTPDSIQPLQQAGRVYASDHSLEQVKGWLIGLAEDNPELAQNADILSAVINIRQGNLRQARTFLDKWEDSETHATQRAMATLLVAEAQAATRSGDYPTARAKAAEVIALEPENVSFALLPVAISQAEGKPDQAFTALDAVEDTFGKEQQIVLSRASLLNQNNGARSAYDYLSEQWKTSGEVWLMPSLISLAKVEAPGDIDELTRSWLDTAPDSIGAHMARADWLMANNREMEAASHYEQVISRQPENITALNNLAWLLRTEDQARALTLANKASELAPESAAVLDTYGWILHLSGKHSQAKEVIEKALALTPESEGIASHLETVKQAM